MSASEGVQETGPMRETLDCVNNEISALDGAINDVRRKLENILTPEVPEKETGETVAPPTANSPVITELSVIRSTIAGQSERLRVLIARIEL
jgi:hypothetical protein